MRASLALISRPRQACNTMNTEPAAHACGEHATGYNVGPLPLRRPNPQINSGSRCWLTFSERSKSPDMTRSASILSADRSAPYAIIALSCGHTEPLWYDMGL